MVDPRILTNSDINPSVLSFEEMTEFAKRDDCLDKMVPSDLRRILNVAFRQGYFECREDAKKATAERIRNL